MLLRVYVRPMTGWREAGLEPEASGVLSYWFGDEPLAGAELCERQAKRWWGGGPEVDQAVRDRFGALVEAAGRGELDDWGKSAWGRLALIILCDQFPRNIYRGTADAFSLDPKAQTLTLAGIEKKQHRELSPEFRQFFLMPLMHSEELAHHDRCVERYAEMIEDASSEALKEAMRGAMKFAHQHRDLIVRFGRYPYRNEALGRDSTAEEREYVEQGGASFGQG